MIVRKGKKIYFDFETISSCPLVDPTDDGPEIMLIRFFHLYPSGEKPNTPVTSFAARAFLHESR